MYKVDHRLIDTDTPGRQLNSMISRTHRYDCPVICILSFKYRFIIEILCLVFYNAAKNVLANCPGNLEIYRLIVCKTIDF